MDNRFLLTYKAPKCAVHFDPTTGEALVDNMNMIADALENKTFTFALWDWTDKNYPAHKENGEMYLYVLGASSSVTPFHGESEFTPAVVKALRDGVGRIAVFPLSWVPGQPESLKPFEFIRVDFEHDIMTNRKVDNNGVK